MATRGRVRRCTADSVPYYSTNARGPVTVRNSLYNLLGLGLPLLVALVAIPVLIDRLGVERFGILTIIWVVVSYFGLFDLGLGRAVTQQVAICNATADVKRMRSVVGTSSALMGALGIAAGIIMLLSAGPLSRQLMTSTEPAEVVHALYWMALAMPAVVLTSGYRGVLEAMGQFGLVNAIRLPMGIFTYAGPLAMVWLGNDDLGGIAAILSVGRIAAFAMHAYLARRALPRGAGWGQWDASLVAPLLRMGGWMTVTNVVSPLMNYTDRFILGIAVSASAVAYYATPQELVLRTGVIPSAVTSALFPVFAAQTISPNPIDLARSMWRYSLVILVVLAPLTTGLIVFADPFLTLWISDEFAAQAGLPLQIMALAALFSGLAQVPFAMLQGRGRADQTAKLHLIQLPLYLALLWYLTVTFGVLGAALAWLVRIGSDMLAMFYLCLRDFRRTAQLLRDPTA